LTAKFVRASALRILLVDGWLIRLTTFTDLGFDFKHYPGWFVGWLAGSQIDEASGSLVGGC
jgi:hypothetical protein